MKPKIKGLCEDCIHNGIDCIHFINFEPDSNFEGEVKKCNEYKPKGDYMEKRIKCDDCGQTVPISIIAKVRNRFVCAICLIKYGIQNRDLINKGKIQTSEE